MTNALIVYENMSALATAADALYKSGFFGDVKTQAQAMVKVMAGAEIGLPPFASMTGIHIVQGKPVLGANLIATLVKNDPRYDYRIKQADGSACVITWYENGKPSGESAFTMAEAQAAGLTGKQTWKAYPSDMLFARALTRGARRYAPGIFGGAPIYTPEEMGVDTDEEGHIIEGQAVTVTTPPPQATNGTPPPPAGEGPYDIIRTTPGGQFIVTAAALLEVTEDAIRERMKALGYERISGKWEERVTMFKALEGYRATQPAAQDDLFGDAEHLDRVAATQAALATAQGQQD